MKRLALAVAFLSVLAALANDVNVSSGYVYLPNPDGSLSGTFSSGASVLHFYCTLTETQFNAFSGDPAVLYGAYADGSLAASAEACHTIMETGGYSQWNIEDVYGEEEDVYVAGVFVYVDAASGTTYYIARVGHTVTSDDFFQDAFVTDLAANASRWEVIAPPAPVAVACTAVSVTNGVLYATYSISDASRFGEIAAGGRTLVSVAADLDRTTGVANVSSPVSLDAATGVFRVVVDPGAAYRAAHSSLFVFGFSKPE